MYYFILYFHHKYLHWNHLYIYIFHLINNYHVQHQYNFQDKESLINKQILYIQDNIYNIHYLSKYLNVNILICITLFMNNQCPTIPINNYNVLLYILNHLYKQDKILNYLIIFLLNLNYMFQIIYNLQNELIKNQQKPYLHIQLILNFFFKKH